MSVNTPNTPGSSNLYSYDVKPEVDSLIEENITKDGTKEFVNLMTSNELSSVGFSKVPIVSVKSELFSAYNTLQRIMMELEDFFLITNVKASLTPSLQEAHYQVCDEVIGNRTMAGPDHISYEEYKYCKKSRTRACRLLLNEYDILISKTAVGYNYDIMAVYECIMEEVRQLINFMDKTIGEEYDDEVEQTLSKEIFYWAKSYKEYTQLFAKEILSISPEIPEAEMDSINKVQAAQFKAFFSIKVNSYNSEIKKLMRPPQKRIGGHVRDVLHEFFESGGEVKKFDGLSFGVGIVVHWNEKKRTYPFRRSGNSFLHYQRKLGVFVGRFQTTKDKHRKQAHGSAGDDQGKKEVRFLHHADGRKMRQAEHSCFRGPQQHVL